MILTSGCDPQINVLFIGAEILRLLKNKTFEIEKIIFEVTNKFDISIDHVILSIDWLYMIKAININDNKIFIDEIK